MPENISAMETRATRPPAPENEITVSRAEIGDAEEILALQKTAFRSEAELHGNWEIEPLKQTLESLRADFREQVFLKAVCENKIIGSVKIKDCGAFCRPGKLIVSPAFRNRGLGRRLMAEAEKIFPAATRFELFTAAGSTQNIRLYESLGYTKREEFSDGENPGLVLVRMTKTITGDAQVH